MSAQYAVGPEKEDFPMAALYWQRRWVPQTAGGFTVADVSEPDAEGCSTVRLTGNPPLIYTVNIHGRRTG